MPEVFINYRTGDEDATARLLDEHLSNRFGGNRIFFASKSIPAGDNYIEKLLSGVRRCHVLLAVIGSRWLVPDGENGKPKLFARGDWIRREIAEAFAHGVRVIPVLVGRQLPLLRPSDLPADLRRLAECQYRRLDHRSAGRDLHALADDLAQLVPPLAEADRTRPAASDRLEAAESGSALNREAPGRAHPQLGGANTVVNHPRGPVNAGSGDQFNGANTNVVHGDQSGPVTFGGPSRQDGDR